MAAGSSCLCDGPGVLGIYRPMHGGLSHPGGPFLELHPSYGWMPPGSDSSSGGRRNIFDVPAPALAGEAAGDSNGSIFATPQSSAAGYARRSPRGRSSWRRAMSRRSGARAAAVLALLAAPALVGVVVTSGAESDSRLEGQDGGSGTPGFGSAARPERAMPAPASPRGRPHARRSGDRGRRRGERGQRPTGGRRRSPASASPQPATPPQPAPTPEPASPTPRSPAPTPEPAPPPPPTGVTPPPPAPVAPKTPERPAPAPVPEGAPPEFM